MVLVKSIFYLVVIDHPAGGRCVLEAALCLRWFQPVVLHVPQLSLGLACRLFICQLKLCHMHTTVAKSMGAQRAKVHHFLT